MTSPLRVLLVDDDVVDREIVKRAFRATPLSAEITEAERAEAALAAVAGARFDIALFDLRLPGLDGLELLTELRQRGSELPVIMLTGQGSEETAVELMKSGASDYLAKGSLTPERLEHSVGRVLRLVATERARREAERALRESEANFRRLAEHLPDHVARFAADGRFLYANRPVPWRAEGAGPVVGRTLAEVGADAPEVLPALEERLRAAFSGGPQQVTVAVAGDAAEAEAARWLEVRFVPEDPPDGGPRTVLTIARDVTAEVVRREEERRRAEIERQLIGIVSHDLRNPIGAVIMSGSVLARKLPADALEPVVESALEVLQSSGQRARRMVSDILDFTKARLGGGIPVSLAEVDLAETVAQVVAETRAAHPERVIALSCSAHARGELDGDRVAQALSNLMVNALAYSAPAEPVTVTVEDRGDEIALAVENRGATIPADVLPRLFKPFQRGDAKPGDRGVSRSVGLGLFIVEQIVRSHRGRIEVRSEDGVTVFRMLLPRRARAGR